MYKLVNIIYTRESCKIYWDRIVFINTKLNQRDGSDRVNIHNENDRIKELTLQAIYNRLEYNTPPITT